MRRRIPSTRALTAFEAAARHESFTRAAEELSLTQSAICRQIAGLEDFLGIQLFSRSRRGVTLTEAGRSYGRQISQRLDGVEMDTLQLMSSRGSGGSVELAVVPTFAARWLVPRLASFAKSNPNLIIHLTARTRPLLFEGTDFDAAIYAGEPTWPGTRAICLMSEEIVPVCSPSLIAPRKRLEAQELQHYPLLQQTTRPYAWRQWFDANGTAHAVDMVGPRYELFSMLIQGAICGMGIALVPTILIEEELAQGRLIYAAGERVVSDRSVYLAYPEHKATNAAVEALRSWLVAETNHYPKAPIGLPIAVG